MPKLVFRQAKIVIFLRPVNRVRQPGDKFKFQNFTCITVSSHNWGWNFLMAASN